MHNAAVLQVGNQCLADQRVVVAVVKGAGTGKEVDKLIPLLIIQKGTLCLVEYRGECADIAANLGFHLFKNTHRHTLLNTMNSVC
jgi:hypothetical protein